MPIKLEVTKVLFNKSIIDRKDWVKYLVLVDWHAKRLEGVITRSPDAAFTKFVEDQVQAYLGGKKVPAAIEPAIMNIADDALSGREVILRSGDYVALQSHYQAR